jgi:hypothetical protein
LSVPTRDFIHDAVKAALVKNHWTITADPYVLQYEDLTLFADMAAERSIAAEREGRKIVVEVKSFLGPSPIRDFEDAIGQFEIYRSVLDATEPERALYLAVGADVFEAFFERPSIQYIVSRLRLALLVVDVENEEILQWIN